MRFLWRRIINDLEGVNTRSFTIAVDCKTYVETATYGNTAEFSFVLIHLCPRSKREAPRKAGHFDFKKDKDYRRESSDNPILNAFCRVAPSVRLRVFAILPAGIFFFAIDFKVLTC